MTWRSTTRLTYTTDVQTLSDANVYIVTTPTPIDAHNQPDLGASPRHRDRRPDAQAWATSSSTNPPSIRAPPRRTACRAGERQRPHLQRGLLRRLQPRAHQPWRQGAPLRDHHQGDLGLDPGGREFVDALYRTVVTAGTHLAPSIKVAEAAKVIENTQRDVNIALINELAHRLQPPRHRHPGRPRGRRHEVELPASSSPASSAATASASTRTTSRTRRRQSAITRRSSSPAAGSTTPWAPTSQRSS